MLYAVGDSHAFNIATQNSDNWINLAIPGKSSTDKKIIESTDLLTPRSTVLVSMGSNDIAFSLKKARQKEHILTIETIVNNIIKVVNLIKEKDCRPVFLLFPKNDIRSAGLLHPYSNDYQNKVRNRIKEELECHTVVEYDYGLADGVHYSIKSYQLIEKDIREKFI